MNPLSNLAKYKLVLASKSPRRKQLLADLGVAFEVVNIDVDESFSESMPIAEVATFLAEKKANAFSEKIRDNQLIITADTIVAQGNKILNKPGDITHAREMLQSLSGKSMK